MPRPALADETIRHLSRRSAKASRPQLDALLAYIEFLEQELEHTKRHLAIARNDDRIGG